MASKSSTLAIWDYFSKVDGPDKMASCTHCSKSFSYRTSITNLKTHLKLKHLEQFHSYINETKTTNKRSYQYTVVGSSGSTSTHSATVNEHQDYESEVPSKKRRGTYKTSGTKRAMRSEESKNIDAMLLKLFARTYQPCSIVEEQDFIEFVQALNPKYELPAYKKISEKLIPSLYNNCLEEQKRRVADEAVSICLTTDCWTSYTMDHFIAVTAHYINNDFEFKTVLLKCSKIESSNTANSLASILLDTANEWDIRHKINLCVTDNTPNIINAVHGLNWQHFGCIAYKLNQCMQSALDLFDFTLKKVTKIVNHYKASYEGKKKLTEYQVKVLEIKTPLVLLNAVPSRWDSTFYMLDRFITLQDALRATMPNVDASLPIITTEEWSAIKQLCKALKPFEHATRILSTETYVCASKSIAVINGLFDVISELNKIPDTFDLVIDLINHLEIELTRSFKDIEHNHNLALCTVLDPRYKLSVFLDDSVIASTKKILKSKIEVLLLEEHRRGTSTPFDNKALNVASEVADDEIYLFKRRDTLIWKSKTETSHYSSVVFSNDIEKEVEIYLNDEYPEDTTDPCQWWKLHQYKYPHLAKLFVGNCNIVTTSVPGERLFSKAGSTLSDRRTRLSAGKVAQLVFLNANLKSTDYSKSRY